jgi:hypothetical protein
MKNWWKTYAQYNVLRVSFQIGWNVTVLVLRRVKISLSLRNYCKDSVMRIIGNLRVSTRHSRDILLQAKGITGIESIQIRWSRDDQAGEAGPVEHSSAEAKSLKLEAKGLSGCHPSGQRPRQPDGKARGQIKDYPRDSLRKNTGLKTTLTGSTVRQKATRRKTLTLCSNLEICRRGWCCRWWRCKWVRTTITDHMSVRQRYIIWGLSLENEG